ncbi:hypothetical protein QQP08_004508 [Theobroma cacao]|nr:hypothetical protein QQP08_004508 [Theobroma cacao]
MNRSCSAKKHIKKQIPQQNSLQFKEKGLFLALSMAADKVPANLIPGTTYLDNGLFHINSAALLSVKLTTTNYSGWRAQFRGSPPWLWSYRLCRWLQAVSSSTPKLEDVLRLERYRL